MTKIITNHRVIKMKNLYQKYFQTDCIKLNSRAEEIKYVRELAAEVVNIASEPRMAAIKQRWCDVNGLRRPDHSPVWCNPVGLWSELLPDSTLGCRDPLLRNLELTFKKLLIKRKIDDDTPINDYFKSGMVFDVTPENVWGVDIVRESLETEGSAWQYKSALQTPSDFDRLAAWISARYHELWTRQMERDAAAGRLDFLFQEAAAERQAGSLHDWPANQE